MVWGRCARSIGFTNRRTKYHIYHISMNVKTNISGKFLALIDKCFP